MQPLISIIVPVYNGQSSVDRCLDSLLCQSHACLEVVAINDGSTDNTAAVLDQRCAQDPRIRVFHIENAGVSNARNRGMEEARGEFVMFVDCDDYLEPHTLERMLACMESDTDMVQCGYRIVSENGTCITVPHIVPMLLDSPASILGEFFKINIIQSACAKLYRATLLNTVRFDTSYAVGEDDFFSFYVCQKARQVRIIDDPLYQYVSNADSVMHKSFGEKHFAIFDILDIQLAKAREDKTLYALCAHKDIKITYEHIYHIFSADAMHEKLPMLRKRLARRLRHWLFSRRYSLRQKAMFILVVCAPAVYCRMQRKRVG